MDLGHNSKDFNTKFNKSAYGVTVKKNMKIFNEA